ncbi:hypothetical protein GGX14DRAFT_511982 [Mycena pura]|uniref:LYR motif-containing protein Cup1-like N-terminal domain-containing protein n=1 Tax=Mycena pura TaxID=153505 RepID=A0AAD6YPN4_9AGAR|nr:hypothetical protein GGX14DRAFT_511982 [Mycena pura]
MTQTQIVFRLYKAFLRQSRALPHLYLRQFWRIKGSDDVRAILKTENRHVRDHKIKRMSKDVRKLEAANNRNTRAFGHVLDVAYGRKGKLKRELMEARYCYELHLDFPILTDPSIPPPPRIISAVESSRPPVYSKELRVLLTSSASRTRSTLKPEALDIPPTLPARADPNSDEAWLLGPFSKRREVNARWRFYQSEWQKVRPPLEVMVDCARDPVFHGGGPEDLRRAGIRGLPMQGLGIFGDVESLASFPQHASSMDPPLPRWVRRRYRELLDRLPVLNYKISQNKESNYTVSLSPNRLSKETHPEAESSDLKWMENTTLPSDKSAVVRYK